MQAEPSLFARITQRRGVRQFVKFGIVGTSGSLVNLVIFTALQFAFPAQKQHLFALFFAVGFMAGGVSNYFLNRIWTFRSTGHAVKEGAQFLTVSAISLAVSLGVSALVIPYLGAGHKAWFVATCSGIAVNFFVNKYWTFRNVQ